MRRDDRTSSDSLPTFPPLEQFKSESRPQSRSPILPNSAIGSIISESLSPTHTKAPAFGVQENSPDKPSPIHANSSFVDWNDVQSRVISWHRVAAEGKFSPNIHILDPLMHCSYLDMLEHYVVTHSEYFRCQGQYDTEDHVYGRSPSNGRYAGKLTDYHWDIIQSRFKALSTDADSKLSDIDLRRLSNTSVNLRKSYKLLCNILDALQYLEDLQFCSGFYSMLVRNDSKDIAELIQIPKSGVERLRHDIEYGITRLSESTTSLELFKILRSNIFGPCNRLLTELQLPTSRMPDNPVQVLAIFRTAVLLLDLALVSYVGSHGSRFDMYPLQIISTVIRIGSLGLENHHITCRLRRLACLDDFLDGARVWIFSLEKSQSGNHQRHQGSERLSVRTQIKTFADIWGPVWFVPADGASNDSFRLYNLSRGCICPSPDMGIALPDGHIPCHWYSTPNTAEEESSKSSRPMKLDDYLVIGGRLLKDTRCTYEVEQYELDNGHNMGFLGTVAETWRLETRTLGFTIGQYVNLAGSGTQKRLPGVTLKEAIWNQFNFNSRIANIEWLDHFLGVEISRCSGNARRIRMRHLFRLPAIQDRLTRISPNWWRTELSVRFADALRDDNFQTMRDLWEDEDVREPIANLLCPILELLHYTGVKANQLITGYFSRYGDKQVQLELSNNEWARCLWDSDRTAVYAVMGDTCLKYRTGAGNIPACIQDQPATTVFKTRVLFQNGRPQQHDYIRLDPHGDVFKVQSVDSGRHITLRSIDGQWAMRGLHHDAKVAIEVLCQYGHRRSREELQVIIEARNSSWRGMTRRMQLPREEHHVPNYRTRQNIVTAERLQARQGPAARPRPRERARRKQSPNGLHCVLL